MQGGSQDPALAHGAAGEMSNAQSDQSAAADTCSRGGAGGSPARGGSALHIGPRAPPDTSSLPQSSRSGMVGIPGEGFAPRIMALSITRAWGGEPQCPLAVWALCMVWSNVGAERGVSGNWHLLFPLLLSVRAKVSLPHQTGD